MFTGTLDPDFESHLLQERLAILYRAYPVEAALTERLMEAIDYQKTVIQGELRVRGMILALGKNLATRTQGSAARLQRWLAHFEKEGALTQEQATRFIQEIQALTS